MDETARLHCCAEPCAEPCASVAQQPRDTGLGPSQLLGPALLTPGPQQHSKGWTGMSIPASRKDSADGAQREAPGVHGECSKFLAGQNRVCWV